MAHQPDNRLEGRLALVTGASGGIGSACALALARAGADLALTYSSNADGVRALESRIIAACTGSTSSAAHGRAPKISLHQADLSDTEQTRDLSTAAAAAHGRGVDILVSNAGYGKRITDILDIPLEEFDKMYTINLRASFLLVQGVVPHMRQQKWGRIIFVSSIAAIGGGINGCHYAASKGGLSGMMRNLASRLAADNISVNDVAPAMVGDTGMIPSAESVPGVVDGIPLQRLGAPEEVANAVLMFAQTGYVTGQSLLMAGGLK